MRDFAGVIFDLDGTLANTLADMGGAMNHVLAARGLPTHPLERYGKFIGDGVPTLALRALPTDQQHRRDEVVGAFREQYFANLVVHSSPYPGIPELLDALTAAQVPLAVLSNKVEPATREVVVRLFARWPFASVRGERPDVPRKPDPTAALQTAAALGVAPEKCVFVGDSGVDVRTAAAAGMFSVGVAWGFRGREELAATGADLIIEHPAQLVDLVLRRAPATRPA